MKINLIPFSPLSDTVTLSLFTQKVENSHPYTLYSDECPALWQQHAELAEQKEMYLKRAAE